MKRHTSLIPLSRQHHAALILAQSLKKGAPDYKGLPTGTEGKADYAARFFEDELKQHFCQEENAVIKKITGTHPALDILCDEIAAEHSELTGLFAQIKTTNDTVTLLDTIGTKLEAHIRKEERTFFPLIQELCYEEQLTEIQLILSA